MRAWSYMPPWHVRLLDAVRTLIHVLLPPAQRVPQGAVVVVLDAIAPYEALWSHRHNRNLKRLLRTARSNGCPVVFTRWARTREYPRDVVARKGHWSEFLPSSDSCFLPDLVQEGDAIAPVVHANAFTSERVRALVGARPVVLAGMWTEACVAATARAAAERDVCAYVAANCCAGHGLSHLLALWSMQALHAFVVRM